MGKAISVNLYVMEFMYSSESEPPFVIWWAHSLYFRMRLNDFTSLLQDGTPRVSHNKLSSNVQFDHSASGFVSLIYFSFVC